MIKFVEGDMFRVQPNFRYNVLINTVNCVGVMGKGVALNFKKRYPAMFHQYKHYCQLGLLVPGGLHFYSVLSYLGDELIINVATKNNWREPSNMDYIDWGINNLIPVFNRLPQGTTVAMPALGCGNGGLDWSGIKSYLKKRLQHNTDNVKVDIYQPLSK